MAENMALCMGTSMRWPLPVRSRASSAMATDTEATMAAKVLAAGSGRNSGSSFPSMCCYTPVEADTMLSQPRSVRCGLSSPKPGMEQ